jgi:hypothetical protein
MTFKTCVAELVQAACEINEDDPTFLNGDYDGFQAAMLPDDECAGRHGLDEIAYKFAVSEHGHNLAAVLGVRKSPDPGPLGRGSPSDCPPIARTPSSHVWAAERPAASDPRSRLPTIIAAMVGPRGGSAGRDSFACGSRGVHLPIKYSILTWFSLEPAAKSKFATTRIVTPKTRPIGSYTASIAA